MTVAMLMLCVVAVFCYGAYQLILRLPQRWQITDKPNPRKIHQRPTPKMGGVVIVPVMLIALAAPQLMPHLLPWAVTPEPLIAGLILIAGMALADDIFYVPAGLRLLAYSAAVLLGMAALPHGGAVLTWNIPTWLNYALVFVGWLWFINAFNFMDGMDGISAQQAMFILLGVLLILTAPLHHVVWVVLVAVMVFWWFNRHPAKLFLGDLGSISLGYVLGFLMLQCVAEGYWFAALILPAYHAIDATLMVLYRLQRGEKIWQPHINHAFQRALRGGLPHAVVLRLMMLVNACALLWLLIFLQLGEPWQWPALIVSWGLAFALTRYFARYAKRDKQKHVE